MDLKEMSEKVVLAQKFLKEREPDLEPDPEPKKEKSKPKKNFGFVGARFYPRLGSWQARVTFNNFTKSLGYFIDPLTCQILHNIAFGELFKKKCAWCGSYFEPTSIHNRCCSDQCKLYERRELKRIKAQEFRKKYTYIERGGVVRTYNYKNLGTLGGILGQHRDEDFLVESKKVAKQKRILIKYEKKV